MSTWTLYTWMNLIQMASSRRSNDFKYVHAFTCTLTDWHYCTVTYSLWWRFEHKSSGSKLRPMSSVNEMSKRVMMMIMINQMIDFVRRWKWLVDFMISFYRKLSYGLWAGSQHTDAPNGRQTDDELGCNQSNTIEVARTASGVPKNDASEKEQRK